MKIWVSFHNDSRCGGVTDVRAWSTQAAALAYINLPENGGALCGWEIHELEVT